MYEQNKQQNKQNPELALIFCCCLFVLFKQEEFQHTILYVFYCMYIMWTYE